MRQLTKNVFVETDLHGPNMGVINTGDGIVVIDTPQKPTQALQFGQELEKIAPVKYVICTEHHADHVLGAPFMPGQFIAHEQARKMLQSKDPAATRAMVQRLDPEGLALLDRYPPKLPGITFSTRLILYLGEQIIELIRLPGHSSSCIGIYLPKERVVFAGDTVFYKVKTFLQEADPEEWLQSLDLLNGLDVDVIVPGHSYDMCDKSYLLEQRRIIHAWVEAVTGAVSRGWSLETAKERTVDPDPYPREKKITFTAKEVSDMNVSNLYRFLHGRA